MSLGWLVNNVVDLTLKVLFLSLQFLVKVVEPLSFHAKSVKLLAQYPIHLQQLPKLSIYLPDSSDIEQDQPNDRGKGRTLEAEAKPLKSRPNFGLKSEAKAKMLRPRPMLQSRSQNQTSDFYALSDTHFARKC